MTESDLDRLYDKHRRWVEEHLAGHEHPPEHATNEPGTSIAEEGAPLQGAALPTSLPARLSVRLAGSRVNRGTIDTELFEDIIIPLQAEVRAAGPDDELTRLDLVGISSGSSILHFEPAVPALETKLAGAPLATGPIDASISQVMDIHDLIERGSGLTGTTFRIDRPMLDCVARLTGGLRRHDVELDLIWRSVTGSRRPSKLGQRGLEYARAIFEPTTVVDEVVVSGYVYSMSLTDQIVLKMRVNVPNSRTYQVEIDARDIDSNGFRLNDFARLRVERSTVADRAGRTISTLYRFLAVEEHQLSLGSDHE